MIIQFSENMNILITLYLLPLESDWSAKGTTKATKSTNNTSRLTNKLTKT